MTDPIRTTESHTRESMVVSIPAPAPQPVKQDTMLNVSTLGIYLGVIIACLTLAGAFMKMLSERRKEDREWMTGKLDATVGKLVDDIKETKAEVKETQKRLHEIEQQRSTDREKIIVLEKDMSHMKASQDRVEKAIDKIGEDQKTSFGELAKSIREIREVRPSLK